MDNFVNFLSDNWEAVSAITLWFAVRIIKTPRNIDIFEMILKFIGTNIIPNRRSTKTKIILLFFALSFFVNNINAQTNGNFKSVRFSNAGSNEGNIPVKSDLGVIYYNQGTNTFRAYQNGVWQDLISSGGGDLATASNGLNVVGGTDVQLGGPLTGFTSINAGSFGLAITTNGQSTSFLDNGMFLEDVSQARIIAAQSISVNSNSGGNIALVSDNQTDITSASNISIASNLNTIGSTGGISLQTGLSGNAESGTISLITGTGQLNSGSINIATGPAVTGIRGDISILGNDVLIEGNNVLLNENNAQFVTGNLSTNQTPSSWVLADLNAVLTVEPLGFDMNLTSEFGDMNFNADGFGFNGTTLTSGSGITGPIIMKTGSHTANGNTGNINISTGNANTNTSGGIIISTGISSGANAGSITIQGGNGVGGRANVLVNGGTLSLVGGINQTRIDLTPLNIVMTGLPTSPVGLPSGALWNNSGVLNITP